MVDKAAKDASSGSNGEHAQLPKFPRYFKGHMPARSSVLTQVHRRGLQMTWAGCFHQDSEGMRSLNLALTWTIYRRIIKDFSRAQASLMLQLRLEHAALNQFLARIGSVGSAVCDHCDDADEARTTFHFLLPWPSHSEASFRC